MSVFIFPIIIHNYIFYISPFIPSAKANGISDNRFNIYIFFQPPTPPFAFFNVHNIEEYVFCEQNPGNPPNSVQKSIDPSLLEANL